MRYFGEVTLATSKTQMVTYGRLLTIPTFGLALKTKKHNNPSSIVSNSH